MEALSRRVRKLEDLAAGPCDPAWLRAEMRFMAAFLTAPLPPGETEESRREFLASTSGLPYDVRICRRMRWLNGRIGVRRNR